MCPTNFADCMKVLKEPVVESTWFVESLPFVVAGEPLVEETPIGFSSLLSSLRKPTEQEEIYIRMCYQHYHVHVHCMCNLHIPNPCTYEWDIVDGMLIHDFNHPWRHLERQGKATQHNRKTKQHNTIHPKQLFFLRKNM